MHERRARFVLVAALVALAVGAISYHSVMAAREPYPGHADYSYYFGLARNIREGKGFGIGYTWHYLNVPRSIHSLPNDYWMPLPSILMATSMVVLGTSLHAALVVGLAAWLGTAALAGFLGRRLTGSFALGAATAAGTLLLPGLISASLVTDGSPLLALFGMGAVVAVVCADSRPAWFAAAGACVGLAELSRQDGLLFAAVVAVAVILLGRRGTRRRLAVSSAVAYLVVVAPLFIANLRTFGAPLPPGPRKAAFLLTYEDLYSYGRVSASTYFGTPMHVLLHQRGAWFGTTWGQLERLLGGREITVLLLAAAAVAVASRACRREWLVALTFPVILGVFHVVVIPVTSVGGGWDRSILAACPVLVAATVAGAARLVEAVHRDRWQGSRRSATALVLALTVVLVVALVRQGEAGDRRVRDVIAQQRTDRAAISHLAGLIPDRAAVVMTRNPWELNELTGQPAVQIPNEDLKTILHVACRTRASYLITDPRRAALRDLQPEVATGRLRPISLPVGLYAMRPC
jgi:4-amino-4-deoxy-L-arabinose transferase-like glycosyltransferase